MPKQPPDVIVRTPPTSDPDRTVRITTAHGHPLGGTLFEPYKPYVEFKFPSVGEGSLHVAIEDPQALRFDLPINEVDQFEDFLFGAFRGPEVMAKVRELLAHSREDLPNIAGVRLPKGVWFGQRSEALRNTLLNGRPTRIPGFGNFVAAHHATKSAYERSTEFLRYDWLPRSQELDIWASETHSGGKPTDRDEIRVVMPVNRTAVATFSITDENRIAVSMPMVDARSEQVAAAQAAEVMTVAGYVFGYHLADALSKKFIGEDGSVESGALNVGHEDATEIELSRGTILVRAGADSRQLVS